jgi:hypothetical protein
MREPLASGPGIGPGTAVVIVLHTPREKCWGVLEELNQAGVFLRGLDLNAFDLFFPMWRVERIAKDEAAGGVPSLCEQIEKRTGLTIQELLRTDDSRAG